ncbi:hypothetical protein M9Y10_021865 [Tritrichomonas musculus]|uniref:Uncharacterized protein n=1 Tax=Tritrichomonas musculus TaxID=1915356 RepID=A0ABR2KQX5_9EUKA
MISAFSLNHRRRDTIDLRYIVLAVLSALVCFMFYLMISTTFFEKSQNHNYDYKSDQFSLIVNLSSSLQKTLSLNPQKVGLYFNYHNTYSCPYYTDRVDLIAPEINRISQFCLSFGMTIIFNSLTDAPTPINPTIKSQIDQSINSKLPLHLDETSPLVKDNCLYEEFDTNPIPLNGSIHHDILYSTQSDLFVSVNEYDSIDKPNKNDKDEVFNYENCYKYNSHINVVYLAKERGLTHLIVGGMKCNMWLPPLFEQLKKAGIQPIYLYDLSDVVFLRSAQLTALDTHTIALKKFWTWINEKYGMILNHFDILDRPLSPKPFARNTRFDGNQDAYSFREFFDPDFYTM